MTTRKPTIRGLGKPFFTKIERSQFKALRSLSRATGRTRISLIREAVDDLLKKRRKP